MDSQAVTSAGVSARTQDHTVASWIHRPPPAPYKYIVYNQNRTIIGIHVPGENVMWLVLAQLWRATGTGTASFIPVPASFSTVWAIQSGMVNVSIR